MEGERHGKKTFEPLLGIKKATGWDGKIFSGHASGGKAGETQARMRL
jgi:hypothetical protein